MSIQPLQTSCNQVPPEATQGSASYSCRNARLLGALHASADCSSAYPGPDMGMSCLPDSVMWLHSKSLLASISASAMVFSVFCMAIILMPQCDRCSACRQHADMYTRPHQQCDTLQCAAGAYSLQAMCKRVSQHHQQCDVVPGATCACIQHKAACV